MKISRNLAIQILKHLDEHKSFYFPFLVMNKEYTEDDDDFVEIEPNEWEMIMEDEKYQTFELWENLQNLDEKTIRLMSKGFLEEILSSKNQMRNFIFYTTEGSTFQPLLNAEYPDYPDVENCQILGWAKGCNPKEAFESLKLEASWLHGSRFDEVIASELKDEKTYYFSLKI